MKTAEKFVECLKNNQPDNIIQYTYSGVSENIDDKESRDFQVEYASIFIKKYGLPSKDKWVINFNPNNNFERLIITIPLFNGYDSSTHLMQSNIVLTFPPHQISDKIYRYETENKFNMDKIPLSAPMPLDPTKKE